MLLSHIFTIIALSVVMSSCACSVFRERLFRRSQLRTIDCHGICNQLTDSVVTACQRHGTSPPASELLGCISLTVPCPAVPVWRVASVVRRRWLSTSPSDRFQPHKLPVTAARLMVTPQDSRQLVQFDAQLRRLQLPSYMDPRHAVESPNGTFVVSHDST